MWYGDELGTNDIIPFWLDFDPNEEIAAVIKFYSEFSMGIQAEEYLTMEEAVFLLYADNDLRTPRHWGWELEAYTILTNWVAQDL